MRLAAAASVAAFAGVVGALWAVRSGTPPPHGGDDEYGSVPRVSGRPHDGMADRIVATYAGAHPVVITDSVAQQWAALTLWTPQYLQTTLRDTGVDLYVSQSSPVFGPYFDPQRPMALAGLPSVVPRHAYRQVAMDGTAALRLLAASAMNAPPFHYLTTALPPALERDLFPFHDLLSPMPARSSLTLWVGQSGAPRTRRPVVSPCHQDGYHNLFVQVRGTKQFTLFPPNASDVLHPFPFLHPSHAQCGANVSQLRPHVAAAAGRRDVTLQPGDMLYLPPLWFHEVTSLSGAPTVSVNVWLGTGEETTASALFQAMQRVGLPLSADRRAALTSAQLRRSVSNVAAVTACAAAVVGMASGQQFLRDVVLQQRYAPLLRSGELPASVSGDAPWVSDGVPCAAAAEWGRCPPELREVVRLGLELGPHTRATWLAHAVELAVGGVVGAQNAAATIHELSSCS